MRTRGVSHAYARETKRSFEVAEGDMVNLPIQGTRI